MINKYYENKQALLKINIVRNILKGLLVLIVVVFAFSLYAKSKTVLNPDTVVPALNEELSILAPDLAAASQEVLIATFPTYKEEAKKELLNIESVIAEKAEEEKIRFEVNLHAILDTEISSSINRLTSKQMGKLSQKFPELGSPVGRRQMQKKFADAVNKELDLISTAIADNVLVTVDMIKSTTNKFDTSKYTSYETSDLHKYFVHLWLMLIDDLIMNPNHSMGAQS